MFGGVGGRWWACGLLVLVVSVFAAGTADAGREPLVAVSASGLWTASTAGGVFALGGASLHGSVAGLPLREPVIAVAATPSGAGYWLAALDGGVFAFGDAHYYGSMGGVALNEPIVGLAATVTGRGYWLVGADGGVFSFGDAHFFGSTGGYRLNQPVVAMTATPTGGGYWLVARDGGVFSFGDAHFYGSTGGIRLNEPIASMGAAPNGHGYWLLGRDGGVFTFGAARFYGSAVGTMSLAVGLVASRTGGGYWIVSSSDQIRAFGDAPAVAAPATTSPTVGIASPWASSSGLALPLLEYIAALATQTQGPAALTWPGPHQVALTFDDGPSPDTLGMLAALTQRGVPATFFVVGYEAAANPDLIRAEVNAGMSVEDHTRDHADLTRLSPAGIDSELQSTADVIQAASGQRPKCFRPPYGATNTTVIAEAARLGLTQVLWNVDPSDYTLPGAATIATRVLAAANGSGLVVGMHDGGGDRSQTIAALPAIIDGLAARGYSFVRLCT
jgi:peptidoglycan/xylan/chitin deacetylase (PgdA/CDA1 family)